MSSCTQLFSTKLNFFFFIFFPFVSLSLSHASSHLSLPSFFPPPFPTLLLSFLLFFTLSLLWRLSNNDFGLLVNLLKKVFLSLNLWSIFFNGNGEEGEKQKRGKIRQPGVDLRFSGWILWRVKFSKWYFHFASLRHFKKSYLIAIIHNNYIVLSVAFWAKHFPRLCNFNLN